MRLEWSRFAVADRDEIFDYIETDSPRAASAIDDKVEILLQFPEVGRVGRVDGTRELVIDRTPYIAVYRLVDDAVRILRILHGSRLWPHDMPD